MNVPDHRPVVLAIGGHDPTGGAGIQADVESIIANGGRAVSLVTALTVQNSARFERCVPVSAADLRAAADTLIDDVVIHAIKIGLVPNAAIAEAIDAIIEKFPHLPVVLDPVLAAGTGNNIADAQTIAALRAMLPHVTVITPNSNEALRLTGTSSLDAAATRMLEAGVKHVLLTGTHADTPDVVNSLYQPTHVMRWHWPRRPHEYHGSGCTLAASLATWLARGVEMTAACSLAQAFTWQSLAQAVPLGKSQRHPQRLDSTEH